MKHPYNRNEDIDQLMHLAELGMLAIQTPEEFRDFIRRVREDAESEANQKNEEALRLAEEVARLNPDAGEIGEGKLRHLQGLACRIVA